MAHLRGAFSKHLAPGYRKVVFETFKERPIEGRKLVNYATSGRAYEDDFPIAGFGALQLKVEGGPVTYDQIIEGASKRYTWSTFGKAWRITEEMVEDDLYGTFGNKMSKSAGRAARNNLEVIMHQPFNSAFNAAVVGFEAGVALCGTHTSLKGISQTNFIASDLDLLSLQAAIEHFAGLLDEAGMPIVINPARLIHSVGDKWIVAQLLKSQFLPGGNQNDINQMANEGLTPHMSHGFITDVDDWFVQGDEHDVNYFQRRAMRMTNSDDFDTGDRKFRLTQRHGSGFGYWYGTYGGQGQ